MSEAWRTRELTEEELDELSATSPAGGFQQTSRFVEMEKASGTQTEIVGLVDEHDRPVAGTLVAYTPGKMGVQGSVWLGPLVDADNPAMVTAMTGALRASAKRHGAISVAAWPGDLYRKYTSDGEPDGQPEAALMENYGNAGWRHEGFTRGYGSIINNWVYVKDLTGLDTPDALLKTYSKNTRRNVKIARNSAVQVRRMDRAELDVFHAICELSSEKQHFQNRDLAYFQRLYDAFGDHADFMVAEIHLDDYLAGWEDKLAKFSRDETRLEKSLQTTKYPEDVERKLKTAKQNVESAHRRIADAKQRIERDGHVVPAAVGLFIWHERELVYYSSGSDERYAKFYAPTALQHEMMSRAIARGLNRYNFYGISGIFDDPSDPGRGVLEFKQGFNGYVEELPGQFTLPVSKLRFAALQAAHKVLGR
ncbi:aminoacyltransferase [Bifidobacterium choloepi]|uniref:Aminoacyltransferase n=1 Tax=Bifidobacterium choloepi TaxID=2614131 RepID=A0A6I5NHG2_9BIFI|nr:aminoacyltransferase [Bifidobacterium choloepi]NEG69753.1 aminoacyltransferase [Bifidobacterium choloepi]